MGYVLEDSKEFDRLELQARQKNYSLYDEFAHLILQDNSKILDAGCGSGVVSRHLVETATAKNIHVRACDASLERLNQAKKYAEQEGGYPIQFDLEDLARLRYRGGEFDVIASRYVIEHLKDPKAVLSEFYRVLKSNGLIYLVDLDGIFVNFYTTNSYFNELLFEFTRHIPVDLFVGRKLAPMLKEVGFKEINWQVTTHYFKGKELEEELQNNRARCEILRPYLKDIFKKEDTVEDFIQMYLSEMKREENTLFHNKFLVWGRK